MTLVDALNLLTALFGLLAAIATVYAILRPKPYRWFRSRWALPGILVLCFGAALITWLVMRGPVREVSIATPARDVTVTMRSEGDRIFYVFAATGSCPECTAEERVQVMVLPPQGGLWIPQRAVTVTNGRWMLNPVYVGNKDNPVREGHDIILQAVAVRERDSADEQQRLASPLDVAEIGVSSDHRLTVVKVERP